MKMHRKKNTRFYAGGPTIVYALCGFHGSMYHRYGMWITKTAPVTCKTCIRIMGKKNG